MNNEPETPQDDTTRWEQNVQDEATRTDPTEQLDLPDSTRAIDVDEQRQPPTPDRPSGPHAPAIVLGLVCLAIAGIILAQELGDLTVDWGDIGPVGIVLTGAVLVLFGLVGLLTSRRNSKTS